jgi:hypothetical protein
MGLAGFALGQEEPMATDLVMSDLEEVAQAEPCGIGHQDPRRQEDPVLAAAETALHLLGRRYPASYASMVDGRRAWQRNLDPAQRTEYTLVQVALLCCEAHERTQHAAMIVDRGGSKMSGRIVQIGVDLVRREIGGNPMQATAEDNELLAVARGSAYAAAIPDGKVQDTHGAYSRRRGAYRQSGDSASAPQNRYNRTSKGQLAQLSRGLLLAGASHRWRILRGLWLTVMTVGIFLHRTEGVLALLVLGHLAEALREAFPPKR